MRDNERQRARETMAMGEGELERLYCVMNLFSFGWGGRNGFGSESESLVGGR